MSRGECLGLTLPSAVARRLEEEMRKSAVVEWRMLGRTIAQQITGDETVTLRLAPHDHGNVLCCLYDMSSDYAHGHLDDERFTAEELETVFLGILRGLRPAGGGV